MELLLGVVLGVVITFLALYLTKKLRMAEDQFAQELQKDVQNERLLLEVVEQVRALRSTHEHQSTQEHQSRSRTRYVHSSDYPVPICISHRSRRRY